MAVDVPLKCSCGTVQGIAKNIAPDTGNHIVCYCDDCQAFAKELKRDADILDEYGGTDIFQVTPSQVEITAGKEHIRCLRLTEKGVYRWYTECCKTPIGNMISGSMPFLGVIHNFMDDEGVRDENLGPVRFYAMSKFATSTPPDDKNGKGFTFFKLLVWVIKLLVNKIKGLHRPNAFFDNAGKPISEPIIVNTVNK